MTFSFFIYTGTESLPDKIHACDNNPEESSTAKISNIQHVATHYSYTVHSITTEAKMIFKEVLTVCKVLCRSTLRIHATEITNYKKKETLLLTNEEN